MTELNCKVVKKIGNSPFLHKPPFSSLSLLSRKKIHSPQVIQFLEGPPPPPPPPPTFNKVQVGGGEGAGSNYVVWILFLKMKT